MAQQIDVPGMGIVEFPDGMSHTDIEAAIQKNMPKPPPMLNVGANAVVKGLAGIADLLPQAAVNISNLGKAGYGTVGHALGMKAENMPDMTDPEALSGWKKALTAAGAIRPENEPQTSGQRVLDTAGQVLGGGGINPVAVSRNLARGSIAPVVRDVAAATTAGTGAGIARELTSNIDLNEGEKNPSVTRDLLTNAIKAGSTFAGAAIPGGIIAAPGTASERASAALKGATPDQLALAKALEADARKRGVPITGYEAIQAVTGQNPKMQTQQRIAEQSDHAAPLTTMMQERPAGNAKLLENAAGAIAPKEQFPDTLAGQLRAAAEKSIDEARKAGNAKAQPFYAVSSNDPNVKIPAAEWYKIASDPAIETALKAVKADPFNKLQNAQPGSLQWLDMAKKWLDSQSQVKAQAGDRFAAGTRSDAAGTITKNVDPVSPDYAKARSIVADNMKNVVEPMQQSQVGKLTESNRFETQANTLLPERPMDVTPSVIKRTVDTIGKQDPDVARKFLAQYLRGTFNEANQQNIGGENVFGGSKFAAKVAGNPAQESNLIAGLKASGANPAELETAINIFRAQGMKPTVNSATSANLAESGAQSTKLADMLLRPMKAVPGLYDKFRNGMSNKQMVEALSSPESVKRLEEMARVNGAYSPTKQQMMAAALAATRGSSQGQGQ